MQTTAYSFKKHSIKAVARFSHKQFPLFINYFTQYFNIRYVHLQLIECAAYFNTKFHSISNYICFIKCTISNWIK